LLRNVQRFAATADGNGRRKILLKAVAAQKLALLGGI
jgi:hypothetical protein